MSLGEYLAEQILTEESKIKRVVAIYPGRFQPMGAHHAKTYKWLQSKFKDAYVATSGKVELPKSPFSFGEKMKIIKSHGIRKVKKVKNPYQSVEILKKYDPETTAVVFMVGKKDAQRLEGGKFFHPWKGKAELGYKEGAYTLIAPHVSMNVPGYGEMSGTAIRKALGDTSLDKKEKLKIFKGIFGHTKNYDMIVNRLETLNEIMEEFCTEFNVAKYITEASAGSTPVAPDSGPRYFRSSMRGYKKYTSKMADRLGWDVVDYIIGDYDLAAFDLDYPKSKLETHATDYPRMAHTGVGAPIGPVSYAPTGIYSPGERLDQPDFRGSAAYNKWKKHIDKIVNTLGWKFVDWSGADEGGIEKQVKRDTKKAPKKDPRTKIAKKAYKNLKKARKTALKKEKQRLPAAAIKKAKKKTTIEPHKGVFESTNKNLGQWLAQQIITEGGAYGHMSHPFDDKGLTFGDFKEIIKLSLQGHLDLESSATEKTDGQNLFITWDGKLKAARNTGDIKRGGVDAKGIAKKFAGRGNIEKAFTYAMKDLSKAIGSLSDKQQKKVFDDGNNWVNMEIMYPASANVIVYDAPYLQFHNVLQYKNGSAIGAVADGARMLAGMITQVNQNVQKNFSVIGPKILKVKPHQDFSEKQSYFLGKLSRLMKPYNMKDTSTFGEYHQAWWEQYVIKNLGDLSNEVKWPLIRRWAFFDKSFRLNAKNIPYPDILEKAKQIDKQKHQAQVKKNMLPFEKLFFELGAEVLRNVENFLAANPDKAIQNIRKQVAAAVKHVRKGGDLKNINKLKAQLDKIQGIGGFKTIVPSEGLVFIYKGKTYKLTGAFAPINQITGMLYF